jgi:hypothetical protein
MSHEPLGTTAPAPPASRPEAAAAAWDPDRAESAAGDDPRRLRRRALVEAGAAAVVGFLLLLWKPPLAAVVWTLAAVTLAAGLLSPTGVYAALRRAVGRFGHLVGLTLTAIFLVPLYYGFFAVFGLLFRHGRRDRMERRFDRAVPSYWKRRAPRDPALTDYERLF